MHILYVGFKGSHNSSYQLVSTLPGEKLFLTNSIPGLNRDIAGISGHYDAVYLFGIDKTLQNTVRIETHAQLGNHTLTTALEPSPIQTTLASFGLSADVSHVPTRYLCNEAYYRLLQKFHRSVLLFHIPGLKYMTDEIMRKLIHTFRPPV